MTLESIENVGHPTPLLQDERKQTVAINANAVIKFLAFLIHFILNKDMFLYKNSKIEFTYILSYHKLGHYYVI